MPYRSDILSDIRSSFLESIDQLVRVDQLRFDEVGELFLYSGNTVKAIVRQELHEPDWKRIIYGLKSLSSKGNLRLHRHVIDGSKWELTPRVPNHATGSLDREVIEGVQALTEARDALASGNIEAMRAAKQSLLRIASRISVEAECQAAALKKMEAV